jgi:Ca-activated chloride channel family protein
MPAPFVLLDFGGVAAPGRLALLLALAALALALAARRRPPALAWPALAEARAAGAHRFDPVRAAAWLLRAGALAALAVALAEPFARAPAAALETPGLDVVLAVDASASMRALDVSHEGETRTRLALAREAVARFAARRTAAGDRVALVIFGETAFTQVPLTRDGSMLHAALARLEPGVAGEATALGDALALSVRRALAGAPAEPEPAAGPGEGRVVVLLSDGRSNAGGVPVDVAIALARRAGVRVHGVAIGTRGDVPVASPTGGVRFERHDVDPETLRRVSDTTGGRFFAVRASRDLDGVYDAIDALERVPRALSGAPAGAPRPEPWLAAAAALLSGEIALARVLGRRLP